MKLIISTFLVLGLFGGTLAYDMSAETCERYMSRSFMEGRLAIFERCDGRIFSGNAKHVKWVTRYTFTDVDGTTYEY